MDFGNLEIDVAIKTCEAILNITDDAVLLHQLVTITHKTKRLKKKRWLLTWRLETSDGVIRIEGEDECTREKWVTDDAFNFEVELMATSSAFEALEEIRAQLLEKKSPVVLH